MEELIRMKRQLEKVKEQIARNEGKHESLMQELKEQGFENIDDAEKYLGELEKQISQMEDQFEEEFKKLKAEANDKL